MGYIENFLPQNIAKMGHEVHIITSTAQVYFDQPFYEKTYYQLLGDGIQAAGQFEENGVIIHRLPFKKILFKKLYLPGLLKKIKEIDPQIIHTFEHTDFDTLRLACLKIASPTFKLFTANHNGYHGIYPLGDSTPFFQRIKNKLYKLYKYPIGRFVSYRVEKCFAATTDASKIAQEWYGVEKQKICLTPLGVDISQFFPEESRRSKMREKLGIRPYQIVCIHTGKLNEFKNPLLLAKAISILNEKYNLPFVGLFIGDGDQKAALKEISYNICLDYQNHSDLPDYYRAADIAVWHLSVTNSFFDAVASGLPLVCGDDVETYALINDVTNTIKPKIVSRFCKINDIGDLVEQLKSLVLNPSTLQLNYDILKELNLKGIEEIQKNFTWEVIAQNRIIDYNNSLGHIK